MKARSLVGVLSFALVLAVLCFGVVACSQPQGTTKENNAIEDAEGFRIERTVLVAYNGKAAEALIPANVTEIATDAFAGDAGRGVNLKKITVPGTVKRIDERAFAFTNAKQIVMEEGVEELGDEAFLDSYPSDVWYPASVTKMGKLVMETEEGLSGTKIHVPKGSYAERYFTENEPYGQFELISE